MGIQEFERYLLNSDRKASTVTDKIKRLKHLLARVKPFNYENFDKFVQKLRLEGKSNNYLNAYIFTIKVYGRMIGDTALESYKQLKSPKTYKATLSDSEIRQIIEIPANRVGISQKTHAFWTMFFELVAYTGCRPGEIASLKVANVDFGRNVLILQDTKTRDTREVPIPHNLQDKLREWITRRKIYVFEGLRGKPISNNAWSKHFVLRVKALGIRRPNLSTYSLRHSYITEMLQQDGVNIFDVKGLVGHKQTSTTEIYYHLGTKRKQEVAKKHPAIKATLDPMEQLKEIVENVNKLDRNIFDLKIEQTKNGIKIDIETRT